MYMYMLQLNVIAVNCYIGGYTGAKLLYLQLLHVHVYQWIHWNDDALTPAVLVDIHQSHCILYRAYNQPW